MSAGKNIINSYKAYSENFNKRREENLPKQIKKLEEAVQDAIKKNVMPHDIHKIFLEIAPDFSNILEATLQFDIDVKDYAEIEINKSVSGDFKIIRILYNHSCVKYYLTINVI